MRRCLLENPIQGGELREAVEVAAHNLLAGWGEGTPCFQGIASPAFGIGRKRKRKNLPSRSKSWRSASRQGGGVPENRPESYRDQGEGRGEKAGAGGNL